MLYIYYRKFKTFKLMLFLNSNLNVVFFVTIINYFVYKLKQNSFNINFFI